MNVYLIYHNNFTLGNVITRIDEIHSDLDNAISRCKELSLMINKGPWRKGTNPYQTSAIKFMLDVGDEFPYTSHTIYVKECELK